MRTVWIFSRRNASKRADAEEIPEAEKADAAAEGDAIIADQRITAVHLIIHLIILRMQMPSDLIVSKYSLEQKYRAGAL